MLLAVRDETAAGQSLYEVAIEFLTERITVKDLVRERVRQEVQYFNRKSGEEFQGLVQPTGAEVVLNGRTTAFRMQEHRRLDVDEQVQRALEGFTNNSYFILINDNQAESLDQEVSISPQTRISFVKLTPLVGG
ncbi:MAG: hypothetical protein JNN08_17710 [Bryobacterales bacterium]|nr:hypothetical protein [Bryobacterales bacterium]